MKYLLPFLFCIGCSCNIDDDVAYHAMLSAGYSDIKILEKFEFFPAWHGCSEGDMVAFKVSAINPAGKLVNATVCSGVIKGSTIRF